MEDQSHASRKEKLRFNDHKKNQVFFNKGQSSSSYATTNDAEQRPPGVKASKRGSGKRIGEALKGVSEFQNLWAIKEKDLEVKERLFKMGLLETLIAKKKRHYLTFKKL
ncbi:hypothetical protein F2Q69_00008161 [Brassica cretica]|uniref:Uncharacterized protein n=1 Tax=Brassica cretica TaxID=69181 RepID=A0A8S9PI12_BRACR|nr:hypothetical protein F2Q69_00008161 [Brassica cretica]